tara:strand:- start:223 stop:441 length:219 start_codon:yes stop_codon:yes gene_type:complete
VAKELRVRQLLAKKYSERTIELDNYFPYSGKEEKVNLKIAYLMEKERRYKSKFARGIKNDMSKYKFKTNEKQ